MNDCQNVAMREALPDLVHGALQEHELILVQDHVTICVDCAEELALIRAVLASAVVPKVDVTVIAAAIPPYRTQTRLGGFQARRYLQLAAAALIGVVGISTAVVRHNAGEAASVSSITQPAASVLGAAPGTPNGGVALVSTSDISDDDLAQLIKDMGNLDAFPPVEPESVVPVALESGA